MSTNIHESAVKSTPAEQSSTSSPSVATATSATLPDSVPQTETTIYRDSRTVIRLRPIQDDGSLCLTMYLPITDETENVTPECNSNWRDEEFNTSPNTVNALSDANYELYTTTVDALSERFGLAVVRPSTGYGICHRRHDSLGKDGMVSFETRLD